MVNGASTSGSKGFSMISQLWCASNWKTTKQPYVTAVVTGILREVATNVEEKYKGLLCSTPTPTPTPMAGKMPRTVYLKLTTAESYRFSAKPTAAF